MDAFHALLPKMLDKEEKSMYNMGIDGILLEKYEGIGKE